MKIQISKTELLEIMSKHFNMAVSEVVISKSPTLHLKIRENLGKALRHEVTLTEKCLNNGPHKIPAIKALRELNPGMGLADAKFAIENWDKWIGFIQEKGRIPTIAWSNGYGSEVKLS